MDNEFSEIDKFVVASDVLFRDGIGVEIYKNGGVVLELFRDDTKKTREIKIFKNEVSLELMEQSIQLFKKEIPWEFIDYDDL
ncbi:hypothetical protein [Pseudemcibacter aquimaris]|uniref:hypothetical protein n=1 Tax=Pseudemcibacter aquimaris TaxID=2857064 RepID=UPI0020111D1B|nr:hypothetical protein [Pseudemcibacter aquimaris]MCC3861410.1 hypothetical protein [Pseudemcibacter aquimaris]WDU58180.1 hypothetical protein KW060_13380 [Pseudemcibacter aquimaris]